MDSRERAWQTDEKMLQEDFSQDGSDFLFGDVHESNVPEFVRREELISQVAP